MPRPIVPGLHLLLTCLCLASGQAWGADQDYDCKIEPMQTIEVRSPVAGLIETVLVRRGDLVHKGQLLVTIDARVERSEVARRKAEAIGALKVAEAKLAGATAKANRNQSLYEDNFVSAQAKDDAEADRRTAEAELQSAKENADIAQAEFAEAQEEVKRRELRSTIDGVVMEQNLFPGSAVDGVEGKKPILKLAQTSTLRVEARLPFAMYQKVKQGVAAAVVPEAPLTGLYSGVVREIDRVIDMASGTFGIEVELDNRGQAIPAGVRCKLTLKQN